MVITFFDCQGMVYIYTVPHSQTVNADYYISVLKQLMKEYIRKKHPHLGENWKLYQNNARPHVAHVVQDFLTQKSIIMSMYQLKVQKPAESLEKTRKSCFSIDEGLLRALDKCIKS